ncbi:MAG: hypothetical protein ACFB2Y_18900 [Fulvivirga sp.]
MKNLTVLLILFLTIQACENNSESVDEVVYDENQKIADANALRFERGPGFREGFTMRPIRLDLEQQYLFKNGTDVYGNSEKYTWQEADKIISEQISKIIKSDSISLTEASYSSNIQLFSLMFIHDFLLVETANKEVVERILHYMEILKRHQCPDLDAMTDALLYIKPYVPNQKFVEFKHYIIGKADKNLEYVKENWKEYYETYKNTDSQNVKNKYMQEGFHLKNLTLEAKYIREKLQSVQ